MKSYLNAKLVLFRQVLNKKSIIISDKEIKPFSLIKNISKQKKFKLLEISKDLKKIKIIYIQNL